MKTTKKEAKKKIVEKLHALSSKFPIAEDLIEAIGKFGLFSCEAYRDCYGRWHLSPYIAHDGSRLYGPETDLIDMIRNARL